MMTRVHVGALALLIASAVPLAARAQAPAQLVEQGLDAREAGDDVRALALFQQAYAAEPAPRTAAQLGLCEQALGSWVDAQRHMREALASTDPWVRRNRRSLEGALVAIDEQVGTVEVLGGVSGASVRLGGRTLGTLPMATPTPAIVGRAMLEVTADGYVPYTVEVVVRGGELTRQMVQLEAVPVVHTPPPVAVEPEPVAVTAPVPPPEPEHGGSVLEEWWFWTIIGVVVVGAVVTTVVLTTQDPGVQSPVGGTAGVAAALRF